MHIRICFDFIVAALNVSIQGLTFRDAIHSCQFIVETVVISYFVAGTVDQPRFSAYTPHVIQQKVGCSPCESRGPSSKLKI